MSATAAADETPDIFHEIIHMLVLMVSRHFRVQVQPRPLDAIVIRAIRRQKVQPHSPTLASQCQTRDLTVMDAVSLQNHVNYLCLWIVFRQRVERFDDLLRRRAPGLLHHLRRVGEEVLSFEPHAVERGQVLLPSELDGKSQNLSRQRHVASGKRQ